MDKTEFRSALRAVGYTCAEFAALTGWSTKTIYEWGTDRSAVPYQARLIVDLLAERKGAQINGSQAPQQSSQRHVRQRAERFRIG